MLLCGQEMLTEELAELLDDNGRTVMHCAAELGNTVVDICVSMMVMMMMVMMMMMMMMVVVMVVVAVSYTHLTLPTNREV